MAGRSDSRNPATTCRGMTSNGRFCKRALAARPQRSIGSSGVLTESLGNTEVMSASFCWQHKDQVRLLENQQSHYRRDRLEKRSSIDSLVGWLGGLAMEDSKKATAQSKIQRESPQDRKEVSRKAKSVPDKGSQFTAQISTKKRPTKRPSRARGHLHFSIFCCMRATDRDDGPPARPRPAPSPRKPDMLQRKYSSPTRATLQTQHSASSQQQTATPPHTRPSFLRDPSSHTTRLLTLIPSTLTPRITANLLNELVKPATTADDRPGYIYIYQLTQHLPPSRGAPSATPLASLLAPSGQATPPPPGSPNLLLKIGRSSNVQRRLSEWTRQCGYEVSLTRCYPDETSRPTDQRASGPQDQKQVPHVQRVERLIHLELADSKAQRPCDGCGKQHREWFEVEPTRQAIRKIDECVKRWVDWAKGEESLG